MSELEQKVDECDGCAFEPVLVKDYGHLFPARGKDPFTSSRGPLWLCHLCAMTALGNIVAYPGSADGGTTRILEAINYGNNAILQAIREQGNA